MDIYGTKGYGVYEKLENYLTSVFVNFISYVLGDYRRRIIELKNKSHHINELEISHKNHVSYSF